MWASMKFLPISSKQRTIAKNNQISPFWFQDNTLVLTAKQSYTYQAKNNGKMYQISQCLVPCLSLVVVLPISIKI